MTCLWSLLEAYGFKTFSLCIHRHIPNRMRMANFKPLAWQGFGSPLHIYIFCQNPCELACLERRRNRERERERERERSGREGGEGEIRTRGREDERRMEGERGGKTRGEGRRERKGGYNFLISGQRPEIKKKQPKNRIWPLGENMEMKAQSRKKGTKTHFCWPFFAIWGLIFPGVSGWKAANGGAKRIVRFGGGKRIKTSFGGLRQWDLPGLCRFPLRKQQGENKRGGGKRIVGGGFQNCFWKGVLWYVFPSPEFSTPLCFSLIR